MVLTMLGIGLAMVASLADYHRLVSIHRPLGILILIVVIIRFVNRHYSTLPPFPATMSPRERSVASASELLLYGLLLLQPLVGWGMLSAARYPITLYGSINLFPILPHNVMSYAVLRRAHTVLAYLLFLTFLAHPVAPFCFTRGSSGMGPSAAWRRGGFARTSSGVAPESRC
jgi:cytochrome b561